MAEDPRQVLYSAIRDENLDAIRSLIISTGNFTHFVNNVCACDVLSFAVRTKNVEVVKLLLENGAEIDNEESRPSALLDAVNIGNEEIVKMLLNRSADLDAKDRFGDSPLYQYTPLYLAIKKNHMAIFELLLNKGADVNAGGTNDAKPVWVATAYGREKMVKLLLEKGADVNAEDMEGTTILNLAVKDNASEIVAHILRSGPDLNNRSNKRALNIAIENAEDKKMTEALLQYGFTIDRDDVIDIDLLYAAVMNGFSTVVMDLLNCGADVNVKHISRLSMHDKDFTLLHAAARSKQTEVARLLINNGANVNAVDRAEKTPIFYAVESEDVNLTKILLNDGATVCNALFNIAVMVGNREIVEMLLQKNINIHERDSIYGTVLHYAARGRKLRVWPPLDEATKKKCVSDKTEIAKLLISRGASVNLLDAEGMTALHYAVRNNNIKVFKVLLEHNANIKTECRNGLTPLHASICAENEAIVKMLLNRGADINAVSREGLTALYIASRKGSENLVEVLLKYGAKYEPRRMENPLSVAVKYGHYKIVELLLNYGLDVDSGDPTPLQTASLNGNVDIFRLLMEHGDNINANIESHGTPISCTRFGTQPFIRNAKKEIACLLEERIVKMKVATMHVDKANLCDVDFKYKYHDLENDCKREIEVMKNEKISNSNVSFHDVLVKDIKQVTMYSRNEAIVEVLGSRQLDEKFPLYCQLIAERFKRGQRRYSLKRLSSELIITRFGYALPENVIDSIFEYLSNAELMFFITACKNGS